ncbi:MULTISPECIES: MFS transporter [Paenibacillus]|uniref:MFS transporter n=1 Tax=Paenibacillus TaxID=44249 RepID=UPI000B84AE4E|nr:MULTISPECIES: MFS transporter [Paenibacillus]MBD8837679.1 MFS transporter [Paenibacillus sp. CFBP 13594]PRA09615.1 MFS transporter [Paenibacillus sp. MYb63]PRA46370.1 MFS transporter [Paenibacillus sp. MYb67]QZN73839.1 MFS transporter [Paenibacillus sp. DR312]
MRVLQHINDEIRGWSRNIQLFFLASILYQIGNGMFSVLYNLYIQGLGYNDTMNGQIVSIQSLATAIMFVPIGLCGDLFSRKRLLITGALFSGIFLIGRSFDYSATGLIWFAVFSGLFAGVFQVLAIPYLAENVKKSQRLKMFSYYSSLVLASQVLGSLGGGVFADLLHTAGLAKVTGLQTVLFVGGAATLAAFIPLLFVTEGKAAPQTTIPAQSDLQPNTNLKESLTNTANTNDSITKKKDSRLIGQFIVTQLLIGLGSGLVVPYLNLYFTNRFSVSLSGMSLLIALGQIMTIVSMLIGPTLAAKVGSVRAVVIFQVMSLPFLLLTGFTNLLFIASLSFLFRQALMNAANPIHSAILVDRISDKRRGIANSLMQTSFMIGWATMGPVQSYLVTTYGTYWGYAITFSITGCLYVISSLMYFVMFREPKPSARALAGS